MTKYEQGEFHDLDIDRNRNLQGSVTGAVIVRPGIHLLVQGHFGGVLHVKDGGLVTIQGSAHGTVAENGGLVLVTGETDWDFEGLPGRVVVGHGSVLTGHESAPSVLHPDGTVGAVPSSSININIEGADSFCYFDHDEKRFVPLAQTTEAR